MQRAIITAALLAIPLISRTINLPVYWHACIDAGCTCTGWHREPTGSALFLILSSLTIWFAPRPFYARIRVYNEPSPKIELSPRRLSPRWERQSNFAKTERIHRISMPFSPKPKIRGKDIDTVETMNKTYGFIWTNIFNYTCNIRSQNIERKRKHK